MSRASHHAESSPRRVAKAKETIKRILRNRHGRENAIASSGLADATGLQSTTVRDLIPEIRKEDNLPIASCSKGYFVIQDKAEFQHVMNRIEETIATKKERQKDLTRAFYS